MAVRLTPEQQSLAESRLGYAFALAHRLCRERRLLDDARGVASLALCYAAAYYDSSRDIPFPAYARRVIVNRLCSWLHRQPAALAETLPNDVPARPDESSSPDDLAAMWHLLECTPLSGNERKVLEAWLAGAKLADLGRSMGLTRERIRQLREQALQQIRERRGG